MKYVIDGSNINSLSDFMWDIIYLTRARQDNPSLKLISTKGIKRPSSINKEGLDSLNDYVNRELAFSSYIEGNIRKYVPSPATLLITDSQHVRKVLDAERGNKTSFFNEVLQILQMNPHLELILE